MTIQDHTTQEAGRRRGVAWLEHGRRRLRALTALGVAAALPAVASASTQGFHVYDYSQYPIQLQGMSGDFSGGHPGDGAVLMPGQGNHDFELTYNFAQNTFGDATYGVEDGLGSQYFTAGFEIGGANTVNAICTRNGAPGTCTPGDWTKGQRNVYYEDPPGTVVNVPASDAQAQFKVLSQLCVNGNASNCSFDLTAPETTIDSPAHQVGNALINNSSLKQSTTITTSDTVGSSNSVGVEAEVGGKIAELVDVKVSASYSHTWDTSHTFEQSVAVTCAAHTKCWITATQPMYRDTGTFTLTLGNTTWHLYGVYFDSPNPGAPGSYEVDTQPLTSSEQATLPQGLSTVRSLGATHASHTTAPGALAKPDLGLSVSGLHSAAPGSQVTLRARLSRSWPKNHATYSVRDVQVQAGDGRHTASASVRQLNPGTPRTRSIAVTIPRSAHRQACFDISASASHATGAHQRVCIPVS